MTKEFREYTHVEKYGNTEVQGIELGTCYIFPKLDGTNASMWYDTATRTRFAGSRKRQLSKEADNAGFWNEMIADPRIIDFFLDHPHLRLYGEWLVPHSLKTYREDAWRKFYIFDVYDDTAKQYLPFEQYEPILKAYNLDYISPICVIKNAQYDTLITQLEANTFLIKDGEGFGEGIVIKNYQYQNKYGRLAYAKMITNSFKEKHTKEMGASYRDEKQMLEQTIVDNNIDKHLVDKTYAKICVENEGWSSKKIPELFGRIWHDMITEDIWDIIKSNKNPTINFSTLYSLTIAKTKQLLPEVF